MITTDFEYLRDTDGLQQESVLGKEVYLHEDHRWLLPIVVDAQERGLLPRPCTLVMFDAHHDALVPHALEEIRRVAKHGVTVAETIRLCKDHLAKMDDDWVIAGMELGIFDNAVVFGVHNCNGDPMFHTDGDGRDHLIWATYSLPGEAMEYQGDLSDHAKRKQLQPLWNALSWNMSNGKFQFQEGAPNILLNFDLDCFSGSIREVSVSWPDRLFENQLLKESTYPTTAGWTGKVFVEKLVERAGIIAICREAECCGGQEVCEENLTKLSRHFFGLNWTLFR